MGVSGLVLAFALVIVGFVMPAQAICANSTWVACADEVLATFLISKDEFEASGGDEDSVREFYCNHTRTYYLDFAECTTTYDCWNFPSAISLRSSRYNISECTSDSISAILGGSAAACPETTCSELLPGSIAKTFSPRSSDSTLASTGTLAALSILAASLIF